MTDLGKLYGFVLRHGETILNEEGLARGVTNTPLSSVGIAQGYQAGNALLGQDVTSIRASALERARHTGKIIGKVLNIPPVFTKRLDTLDIGSLTKQPDEKIKSVVAKLSVDEPNKKFPNGQSFNEWARFIWPEIHYFFLLVRYGRHPVIVTHGRVTNTIQALIRGECKYLDKDTLRQAPSQKNGEIYAVTFDGQQFHYIQFHSPSSETRNTKGSI